MSKPKDKILYELAKEIVYPLYDKPSAYRSGSLVKKYKELYNSKYGNNDAYEGKKELIGLTRWFKEDWRDINPNKNISSYPVYRPTKRVSINTPLTVNELSQQRIKDQSVLKQLLKGMKNLPPF
jgi:hypothetical protein